MSATKQTLPKGWRWAKLGDICEAKTNTRDPRLNQDSEFTYIDITSIDNARKSIIEPKILLGKDAPSRARQVVQVGDIIVSTTRPNLNAIAKITPEFDGQICSTGFCVLRPIPKDIDSMFLFFFVQSRGFVKELSDLVKGALYPAVTDKDVRAREIPLPPLGEQKRIAAYLNEQMRHIEQARQAAEESLYLAWDLPSAYLKNAFESIDAQIWKTVKLGEILASTKNGLYKLDKYYGRGKPILKMYNIGRLDGTWNLDRVDYIELTDSEYEDYRLNKGDILINRVNSRELVGKCAVINEKVDGAVYESKNIRIRLERERAEAEFVAAYINSKYGRDQFERSLKQIVGQATINRSDLDAFEIPLPSLDTQNQLMKSLNSKQENARSLAASIESQLAEINELPSALLRQAFAGEL